MQNFGPLRAWTPYKHGHWFVKFIVKYNTFPLIEYRFFSPPIAVYVKLWTQKVQILIPSWGLLYLCIFDSIYQNDVSSPKLPVSMDCPFFIFPTLFSNLYILTFPLLILNEFEFWCLMPLSAIYWFRRKYFFHQTEIHVCYDHHKK